MASYFVQKQIFNITVKKSPWYCGRDHSITAVLVVHLFIEFRYYTRTFIKKKAWIDYRLASARMTKSGGGSSDDDYCARKSHVMYQVLVIIATYHVMLMGYISYSGTSALVHTVQALANTVQVRVGLAPP